MDLVRKKTEYTGLEVAVIGMTCRYPGANNLEEFWENLKNGVESIHFFTPEEREASDRSQEFWNKPNFVPARGVIERPEYFDTSFFGYKPLEAEIMDPQMRLFYECCWEALELSGYIPEMFEGLIGVYAGANNNRGWELPMLFSERSNLLGAFAREHLIDRDFLSTRIAYKLNLRGPAITLKTACSTGLVTVDLACRGLLTGQCDIALAGAAALLSNGALGYVYTEGMIHSLDGHVRSFDANSKGVVFSEGVGVVTLRRLTDAIEERDNILAVIRSSSVNNDGSRKGAYEAPCVEGQQEVIQAAIHMAEVEPESITYVETHGTGTIIGDPIEIEALKRAFNTDKKQYCAVGSVKSNFGHTDTTAGIAGFMKTVLSLKHRLIPPSLHYENPNPKINFAGTPFYVNTIPREWKNDRYPLRAGVSSFGVGGTNAHAVLEEAPEPGETSTSRNWQMLLVSARTETALEKASENLMEYINKHPEIPLPEIAYTLQLGRRAFKFRKMWMMEASTPDFRNPHVAVARDKNRLVFMFSGQGAQYVNMGLDLYRTERIFRQETDRCLELLKPLMGYDLKEILYPGPSGEGSAEGKEAPEPDINRTEVTQPLIFVFEYAMAQLLMHWGLKPYAMIGHSIGEYVAACLSGVFSLEDALAIVAARGKLMQQMPTGAMLSVTLPEQDLIPLLQTHTSLSLAAVNAPSLCVVSGPHEEVEAFENQLKEKNIENRLLHTSHAFHSMMMDPVLGQFEQTVRKITLNKPQLPYISNVSGQWITVEEATSPAYWAKHLRGTVRFNDGLAELAKDTNSIFLELGPGRSLATFVNKHELKNEQHVVINLIKHPREVSPDDYYLLSKIGQLWLYGVNIDWHAYYSDEKRKRVPLPTYPFERQFYRLEEGMGVLAAGKIPGGTEGMAMTRLEKRPEIKEWFYIPSWKRSTVAPGIKEDNRSNWLIFMDKQEPGLGALLVKRLKQETPDAAVTLVHMGASFASPGSGDDSLVYTIDPREESDYRDLIKELVKLGRKPERILHLWEVTGRDDTLRGTGSGWAAHQEVFEERGFYSLIYLVKALGMEGIGEQIELIVISDQMQHVTGDEDICPPKATLLGPVRVIPMENPNIRCRSIDIIQPLPGSPLETRLVKQLTTEILGETPDTVIAYRNHFRLVQTYESVLLDSATAKVDSTQKQYPARLKSGGVYLITGGLGGIGMEIARHLAVQVGVRLILISRSSIPDRQEWRNWLETHSRRDKTSVKIRKIQELEAAGNGAQVMVFSGDISDMQRMQTIITEVEQQFGKINGVIHAAGVPGGGVIQLKTPGIAREVMSVKTKGTLVLETVLKNHPLDFFLLCSSINSVVPMFGQVDYFAANAFLDAFAAYKASQVERETLTVSINWDTWQEVGMAVEAAKQWSGSRQLREIQHPLFDEWYQEDQDQAVFVTYFNLERHWVLNEHKIAESGKGLAPGVTYLEMARQALESYSGNNIAAGGGQVEISDVYFLNPLIVGKDEERETRFILRRQSENPNNTNEFEFLVQSRAENDDNNWQKHAVGKIKWQEKTEEPVKYSLDEIAGEWVENEIELSQLSHEERKKLKQGGLLEFGQRWHNTRKFQLGRRQGLVKLELPGTFSPELSIVKLYPALLDNSTGFLFSHVGKGAYIPFAYKRLTMKAPLPDKIYSYSRVVEEGDTEQRESLKFDVTIMDEQGKVLVEINEFTMLRVSEEVQDKVRQKEQSSFSPQQPLQEETRDEKEMLKNGILPNEGLEVVNRILAATLPQVVVSTMDLGMRLEYSSKSPLANRAGESVEGRAESGAPKAPVKLHPRPAVSSVYVAPQTEREHKIAAVWQNLLGLEQVGVNDDFFELGGDSLNVVQLNNELKKVFNREIPVAVMFRYQTIQAFSQYLQQEETGQSVADNEEDRSDVIEKGRDRIRARMKKR